MTLYDFMSIAENDYDTYDTVYDAVVTVCSIDFDEIEEDYDRFTIEIMKYVNVCKISDVCLVVNWSEFIKRNFDKFKSFTKKYWKKNRQFEDDEDEFIYQWINEIHNYLSGNVSESFYSVLLDFLKELK